MGSLRVCVYCASSKQCDLAYLDAAERLGRHLARHQATLVYGERYVKHRGYSGA